MRKRERGNCLKSKDKAYVRESTVNQKLRENQNLSKSIAFKVLRYHSVRLIVGYE